MANLRCPHHVMQNGGNRKALFLTDQDRDRYLATLRSLRRQYALKVYAYCLMTTHVHLVLGAVQHGAVLNAVMQRLSCVPARWVASSPVYERHGRRASWRSRFLSLPLDSTGYLHHCIRYVEFNPVEARMVQRPEDYRWSSYSARLDGKDEDLLDLLPT